MARAYMIFVVMLLCSPVTSQDSFYTCSSLRDWAQRHKTSDVGRCWFSLDCMDFWCLGSFAFRGQMQGKLHLQVLPCTTPPSFGLQVEAMFQDQPISINYTGTGSDVTLLRDPQPVVLTVFLDQSGSMVVTQGADIAMGSDMVLLFPPSILNTDVHCAFPRELLFTGVAVACLLLAGCTTGCFAWVRVRAASTASRTTPPAADSTEGHPAATATPDHPLFGIPLELAGNSRPWTVAVGVPQGVAGQMQAVRSVPRMPDLEDGYTCDDSFAPHSNVSGPSSPTLDLVCCKFDRSMSESQFEPDPSSPAPVHGAVSPSPSAPEGHQTSPAPSSPLLWGDPASAAVSLGDLALHIDQGCGAANDHR
eukprot:EG_transcript_10802